MTERGRKHLEQILHDFADQAMIDADDPWPALQDRLGRSARPWRRRLLPRSRVGWIIAALVAALFGATAYAASTTEKVISDVTIERAALQEAPGQDQMVVRVRATGSVELPWCYLSHGSSIQGSTWIDDDLTEQRNFGDIAVFTFFEDTSPSGAFVDPSRTPFFVSCSAGTNPGGDGPGSRYDEAHVAGTAPGETPMPTNDREFVKKDMQFQQITPPASTLTSNGRTVEGEFGTYCWSPGHRDEDENALWCWDEQENNGVPKQNKTLNVSPGSTLVFDFGGEVAPERADAGAAPLAYGRLTGGAGIDLSVASDGRIQVPDDTKAGEYAMGVFVSGLQGEVEYLFRIDVDREAKP